MVCIELIFRGNNNDLWCFCYQYIIWLVSCLINRWLCTASIVAWYKHKNISHSIPFLEVFIWGWKFYIINSKQGKKVSEARTAKYPCACPPSIDPSFIDPGADGSFMRYYNSTKAVIYFEPKTLHIKKTFRCYIDVYDIKLHPEKYISLGALMLQEYPSGL